MHRAVAAFAGLVLATSPAWAGDGRLELGLTASMNYEDNVFGNPHDEEGDFYLSVGPLLRAYDERGNLQWSVDYNPTYLKYVEFDQLDDWEQFARGAMSWVQSDRLRVFASAEYVDASSFQRLAVVDPDLGDTGVELTTQGVERTTLEAGAEYRLTHRQAATLKLERFENDYELISRQDVEVTDASLEWLYDLTPRDRTGISVRFSRQEFARPGEDQQQTDYYNLSAVWNHIFDPTLLLSISAGPALVEPDEPQTFSSTGRRFPLIVGANGAFGPTLASTCPTLDDGTPFLSGACQTLPLFFVPGLDDSQKTISVIGGTPDGGGTDTTYFAAVSLIKKWQNVSGELTYSRDTSTSGDFGGSSVRDLVRGRLNWRVTRRFRSDLELSYQRFEAATKSLTFVVALQPSPVLGEAIGFRAVLIDNEREDQIYWARVRFSYDITPRATASLSVIWQTQIVEVPPQLPVKVDRLLVIVGLTYKFRSIPIGI